MKRKQKQKLERKTKIKFTPIDYSSMDLLVPFAMDKLFLAMA